MFDSRLGTDPYRADPGEFEADVQRLVDQWWDDLEMEVDYIIVGFGRIVVYGINGALVLSDPPAFDSIDGFREFVEQYAPEDYR